MKTRAKTQEQSLPKNDSQIERAFYRALASIMGCLFLIQCLWANLTVMIFASLVGTMCLLYGLYPRKLSS